MLRLTKLTDYGIVLMSVLADREGERMTASDLSRKTHIPMPTVSKILQMLLHGNLLQSSRGVGGGYRLARSPRQISIQEIIQALEGPIALTECNSDARHCEQEDFCAIKQNWQKVNAAVRQALASISLADMIGQNFQPHLVFLREGEGTTRSNDVRT